MGKKPSLKKNGIRKSVRGKKNFFAWKKAEKYGGTKSDMKLWKNPKWGRKIGPKFWIEKPSMKKKISIKKCAEKKIFFMLGRKAENGEEQNQT